MSGEVVAGRRVVLEAILAGIVREVLVAPGSRDTQGLRQIREAARAARIPVRTTERRELDRLAADHHGVVARIGSEARRPEMGERELASFPFASDAIVVVLDGITDPQNLGATARAAEAAGAAALVSRTRRAAGVTPAALRASAGALFHLPHARVANIGRAIDRLRDARFTVVGLDERATRTIYEEPCPPGRLALVVGSEGEGISRSVRERCDLLVALPLLGRVASLNAAASLTAVLYGSVLPTRLTDVVASHHRSD